MVYRCAYPSASDTNQNRLPPSYQPPQPTQGPPTQALSFSTSTCLTAPESETVWIHRRLKSELVVKSNACDPSSFQPMTWTANGVRPSSVTRKKRTVPDGRDM